MKSHLVRALHVVGSFSIVACVFPLVASAQDQTVSGNLSVIGGADIEGSALSLGTQTGTGGGPGLGIIYGDGTSPTIDFSATRATANWIWQSSGNIQFQVDGTNTLSLFIPGGATAGIVLNPAGTSTISGALTVNGAFTAPSANMSIGTSSSAARLTVAGPDDLSTDSVLGLTNLSGAPLLFVNDAGQVGIGTSTPTAKLNIASNTASGSADTLEEYTWTSDPVDWGLSLQQQYTGNSVDYNWMLGTGTATPVTALSFSGHTGNVGIGDSAYNLSTSWHGGLAVGRSGADKVVIGPVVSAYSGATIGSHTTTLASWAPLNIAATAIIFRANGETEAARITPTGNVGIGTTQPVATLDVAGTAQVRGVFHVPPSGDLSMGGFTAGTNPASQ